MSVMRSDTLRVLAFTKYDREAASTRQRLLQYLPSFRRAGIEVEYRSLLSNDYVRSLAHGSAVSSMQILRAYAQRMRELMSKTDADLVWIYAELFPWLPASFERMAFRPGRPIIYDWDDAFFVPYDEARRPAVRRLLGGKLRPLLRGASACTCGNGYLADHARQFCDRVLVVPTVVDTDLYKPAPTASAAPPTIGWIGSPTTWANVRPLLPELRSLCDRFGARLRVVGAGKRAKADRFEGMDLIEWSEATEIADVQAMDVGIMPLTNTPFERGKSGYKLVQYMACGLPVVASPVGVNTEIVQEGVNGFLATTSKDWSSRLEQLLGDAALRHRMGAAGRERAVERYSLASQAPRLIDLFRSVAGQARR